MPVAKRAFNMKASINTLTMNIKREHFAKILAGTKVVEYRSMSAYWMTRLTKVGPVPFRLRLLNGMTPPVPEATVMVTGVVLDQATQRIQFHLGAIVEVVNWNREANWPK